MSYDAAFDGYLTTEKGEVFDISNKCNAGEPNGYLTFSIPVLKGMKLHISLIRCSKNDTNRISFLPLKEIE